MNHKPRVKRARNPGDGNSQPCRDLTIRERLLHFLLDNGKRITIQITESGVGIFLESEAEKGKRSNEESK